MGQKLSSDLIGYWSLEGILPDGEKWIIQIDSNPFIIGRDKDCNLCLVSAEISRKHSEIIISGSSLSIKDLKSTNGTYVNNKQIKDMQTLCSGDVVQLGESKFYVLNKEDDTKDDSVGTMLIQMTEKDTSFAKAHDLSKREEEIMYLLLEGMSTKKIANKLYITAGTAKNHILSIYKKTHTHSKFELLTVFNKYNSTHP